MTDITEAKEHRGRGRPKGRRGSHPDTASELLAGFITVEQFAKAMDKSLSAVRRWLTEGLPSIKVGTTRLINIESARSWFAKSSSGGLEPSRKRSASKRGRK